MPRVARIQPVPLPPVSPLVDTFLRTLAGVYARLALEDGYVTQHAPSANRPTRLAPTRPLPDTADTTRPTVRKARRQVATQETATPTARGRKRFVAVSDPA
jgi:hypothetical protein